jgi:hypothetical protein
LRDHDFVFIEDVTKYKYFDVFRHPHLFQTSDKDLKRLQAKLIGLIPEVIYREYPPVNAFRRFPVARIFKIILDAYSKIQKKAIPGPFCSELVSRFYGRLNIPLFSKRIHHRKVSPTRLSRSRLINITNDLVYEPNVESPNDKIFLGEINESSIFIRSTIQTPFLRFAVELSRSLKKSRVFIGADRKEMIELARTMRDLTIDSQSLKRGINNDWIFWSIVAAIKRCRKGCTTCKLPSDCEVFHKVMMKRLDKMKKEKGIEHGTTVKSWD